MSASSAARRRFPIGLDSFAKSAPTKRVKVIRADTKTAPTASKASASSATPRRAASLVPAGALSSAALRQRMVARIAEEGVRDPRVLEAMSRIPRHAFVDPGLVVQAYEDTALPIGQGQTISKPSVVARMLALLHGGAAAQRTSSLGRTLEIGTGCGYQAALLSLLGSTVISVERLRVLHDSARDRLADVPEARRTALRLVLGDGRLGHPPNAPYDSIVAAAVGEAVPQAWIDQLAIGGRLVTPQVLGDAQVLVVIDRHEHGIMRVDHEAVRFVPLESGVIA
jgi:protein-L-isoaspartate(D-aspartate) O-methyltransferase